MTPLGSQAPVVGPGWPLPPPALGLLRCVSSPCLWGRDITCLSKMPPGGQSDLSWAIPLSNSTPNLSSKSKGLFLQINPLSTSPCRVPGTPDTQPSQSPPPRHQTRSPEWISLPQPPACSSIPRSQPEHLSKSGQIPSALHSNLAWPLPTHSNRKVFSLSPLSMMC